MKDLWGLMHFGSERLHREDDLDVLGNSCSNLCRRANISINTFRNGCCQKPKGKNILWKGCFSKDEKPSGFTYRSGMYVFVQCPQISNFEWHPYSLTSAPDDDDLSIHVRSLGDWSYQFYSIFQEALISAQPNLPKIAIDGPYGSASQDHSKYEIVLLIGLGIGATPFISVLKDIANGINKPKLRSY